VNVRYGTSEGRWVLAAAVLGSGLAFLDGTVVEVALPAIGEDLEAGVRGLQWIFDSYLVTLSALLLVGGALGDLYGRRRVFEIGLAAFTAASLLCGLAPTTEVLVAARALQGAAAALLIPGSLAILSANFHPDDRNRAIGAWSGLSAVSTVVGPFVGGWLADAVTWRAVFLLNLPLAAATFVSARRVEESRDEQAGRPDAPGALTASLGLAATTFALIEAPGRGWTDAAVAGAGAAGVVALALFFVVEARRADPMLPLELFRSRQFTAANAMTLAVYTVPTGALFLLVLMLQQVMGYSATEAGAALVPSMVVLIALSVKVGEVAQRTGPRLPMTVGPMIIAAGTALAARVGPGSTYLVDVLPAMAVLGLGLAVTVAPLTAAVLASVEERHLGVGSGVNNAVARVAGLLAVAVLPGIAGLGDHAAGSGAFVDGYSTGMYVAAGLAVLGGLIALVGIRSGRAVQTTTHPAVEHACHHPDVCDVRRAA
jgi:EmrB/QacA subfamily drug resistance transporter